MSTSGASESGENTGFELQQALAPVVGDPVGEALNDLEPPSLLKLLAGLPIGSVRSFLADYRVPARRPDLVAAQRVLPNVRRARGPERRKAVRWLTAKLNEDMHHALVQSVGSPEDAVHHRDLNLGNLLDDYGPAALRLAALSYWGTRRCELDLAMLVVDGRAVAERWRPHMESLTPLARHIVDEFNDDEHPKAAADESEESETGSEDAGIHEDDTPEMGEAAAATEPAAPAPPEPHLTAGQAATGADAVGDALDAIARLRAAVQDLGSALATVRAVAGGPASRVSGVKADPGVKDDDLAGLRHYAAGVTGGSDPAGAEFLGALARLCDLIGAGAADEEVMAAEDAVLALPVANRFRSMVFAAARGRLTIPAATPVDPRLIPWMGLDLAGLLPADEAATADAGSVDAAAVEPPADVAAMPEQAVELNKDNDADVGEPSVETPPASPVVSEPEPDADIAAASSSPEAAVEDGGAAEIPATPAAGAGAGDSVPATGPAPTVPAAELDTATPDRSASPAATVHPPVTSPEPPPAAEAAVPAPRSGAVADAFGRMFAERSWGLARWLAVAEGDHKRAGALEAVAYADWARSSTGRLALLFTSAGEALSPQELGADRPAQLLGLAAATRACLVAPFSNPAQAASALGRSFEIELPALAAIAEAVSESALHGVDFSGEVVASLLDATAAEGRLEAFAAEADSMLNRTGRTGFPRADKIWSDWVSAGGPIRELLGPAADMDPSRAAAVRTAVFEYSKDAVLNSRVDSSDDRHRGPGKVKIEGLARKALISRFREALRIAGEWLEAARAGSPARADDHAMAVATRIRTAMHTHFPALEAGLAEWASGPDPEMAGAATGAALMFGATRALVDGVRLAGTEPDPAALMNRDLLRTGTALDSQLTPLDPNAVTVETILEAEHRDWDTAFAKRSKTGDHIATGAIVDAVSKTDAAHGEQLRQTREAVLSEARAGTNEKIRALAEELRGARRAGRVDEDTASVLEAKLAASTEAGRVDIGAVDAELDDIRSGLNEATAKAVQVFSARLEEAAPTPAVATAKARFDALLADMDLATAEELLLQLLEGTPLPAEHRPDVDFEEFFPHVVAHLAGGITEELINAAAGRNVDGPLDFSGLSAEAAEGAAAALRSWRRVATGERQAGKSQALAPALRALGLEFRGEKSPGLPASNDRAWMDLKDVTRVGQALVPQFGTYSDPELRLLMVWKQPGESLLQWVEQDHSERPVVVLYFGTMPAELREKIARRLRSHRNVQPVVVVDDAVLAWAVSLGSQSFNVPMRATLPFSAVNPYEPGVAGAVPIEMFYGRDEERSDVLSPTGTSLIYGGRRLGKSALLRAAGSRFDAVQGQVAVYIDLSAAAVGTRGRPEAVWDLVSAKLIEFSVAERPGAKRVITDTFEHASTAIRSYLAGGDSRRVLLLLDECDDFFDTDAKDADFMQTRRLKDLMESTNRRFKVVFAGLHQVARFSSYPNQPLAHLGRPRAIGPLAPQPAHNLIAKPFLALGWKFASEDLINRVLAYCNYTPILLQEFGHTLIKHLHSRSADSGPPPATITTDDIDEVLSAGSLDDAIRSRFNLTLSLDSRYKMIAYVLALHTHERGRGEESMTAQELLGACREWWGNGFAAVNSDEFRALLDELVGLGVLSSDRGAWRMRSPNVLRLLGTKAAIEAGLLELAREDPAPGGFFSADAHRTLEGAGPSSGRKLRSPFTEQQLADVIGEGRNRLRIVVGTPATGADQVGEVLAASAALSERWQLIMPSKSAGFARSIADVPARSHRVVFSDLREVSPDAVHRAVAAAAKHPTSQGATCSAVILVSPSGLPVVDEALAEIGLAVDQVARFRRHPGWSGGVRPFDQFRGRPIGVDDVEIVALRRYNESGLLAWAVEVESGFTEDSARRRLAEMTGGWPVLVDEVEESARSRSAKRALDGLEKSLPERASSLIAQVGLSDGFVSQAWETAVEVLGFEGREAAETLAEFLAVDEIPGEVAVRALIAAGVLVDDGGRLGLEPVVAQAWERKRQV